MFGSRLLKLGLFGACAFALFLSACDSSTVSPDPETAPVLISSDAFSIDSDSFQSESLQLGGETSLFHGANHTQAAARVFLVNTAVGIHLVVPSAATAAATQVTPFVDSGTWVWENTLPVNGQPITFRLEGTPDGSDIDWRMILSNTTIGGQTYNDFVIYTATTSIDGTEGSWSLFYNIDGVRTRVLDANYLRTGSRRELTFSIPQSNPNEDARGDSVYYMSEMEARVFDYEEAPSMNHLIEWDAVTFAGSITAWNWNNGEQACWDSNLDNVSCTPAAL